MSSRACAFCILIVGVVTTALTMLFLFDPNDEPWVQDLCVWIPASAFGVLVGCTSALEQRARQPRSSTDGQRNA